MSMKNGAILSEALISMRATGLRSFLTMLGIIIGVGHDRCDHCLHGCKPRREFARIMLNQNADKALI